jgi:uncharacterized protein YggL (DUF469 family)
MRRRLRKKLRRGEFVEQTMTVTVRLSPDLDVTTATRWFRELEHRVLEKHGIWWLCSYGNGHFEEMILSHASRYGVISEEQRAWLERWLSEQPEVVEHSVGAVTACVD